MRTMETPALPGNSPELLTGAHTEPIRAITPSCRCPGWLAVAGKPSQGPSV